MANSDPILVAISGYDKDPRELWELPEVALLCQRAIESGFISLLAPNMGADRVPELLGAWDVWAIATGSFVAGISELTPANLVTYQAMLSEANERADVLIANGPSDRKKAWYLTDGPGGIARYWFGEPNQAI